MRDRSHLRLIPGGKRDEDNARLHLYAERLRVVRAEPKPVPYPRPNDPRPAA